VDDPHEIRPPRPGPRMDFLTIKSTQPTKLIVISRRIWAHHIHWVGEHTVPCTLDKSGSCEHCTPSTSRRWKGYLHVLRYDLSFKPAFLCITPGCGYELLNGQAKDYSFRGKMISVWRSGKNPTSLMLYKWEDWWEASFELTQELDPKPFLDQVFRRKPRKEKPL
jgi:hypothetical protein